MNHECLSNFTHEELSSFTNLSLKLNSLEQISDKLSRNELTIPEETANRIFSALPQFFPYDLDKMKTLTDIIHLGKIACTMYSSISSEAEFITVFISALDDLLQYFSFRQK